MQRKGDSHKWNKYRKRCHWDFWFSQYLQISPLQKTHPKAKVD